MNRQNYSLGAVYAIEIPEKTLVSRIEIDPTTQ